jgi:hypothetical protein
MSGAGKTIRWSAAAAVVGVTVVATGARLGAALRARSAPAPQAARRTAQAGGAPRSVASWPAGLPSVVRAAAYARR